MPDLFGLLPETPITAKGYPLGWVDDPEAVEEVVMSLLEDDATGSPVFAVAADPILGTGEGKVALLFKAIRQVTGGDIIRRQQIGDCVGNGHALAVDVITCVAIVAGERARWVAQTATEPIYAGSRVEIGGGRLSGDGSNGAWAAKWLTDYGALPRDRYGDIDLTEYDPDIARKWGAPGRGVPDGLEPTLRQHPVKTASRVRSYNDARDALANGYSVTFSSNQGFTQVRDGQGFCRPSGSWAHCMGAIGVDDESGRPGVLIQNSWGATGCRGPKRHDQPEGSFWADAEVIERMCRSGDCWAFSGYVGFPRQDDLDLGGLVPE